MKWTRIAGTFLSVTIFSLTLAGFSQSQASSVAPNCSAEGKVPVTFLARSGFTNARFEPLVSDGFAPFVDAATSSTYVYVRTLVEAISPEAGSASWDAGTRTATFKHNGKTLAITYRQGQASASTAMLNGRSIPFTSFICNGNITAPARSVTQAFGVQIKWHESRVVVVDPVWETAAQPTSPAAHSTAPSSNLQASGSGVCDVSFPSLWDVITSPNSGSRQAAKTAACKWLGR